VVLNLEKSFQQLLAFVKQSQQMIASLASIEVSPQQADDPEPKEWTV
jgi:hypothetical protein